MINLLSPTSKSEIRAARLNVKLRRYAVLTFFVAIGVLVIYGVGFYFVMQEKSIAESQLRDDQSATSQYNAVKAEAKEYRTNLAIAKKVLSTGMNYSSFVTEIARILPGGSVLTTLNLSSLATGTTTTATANTLVLQGRTSSYGTALLVKEQLELSDLFENVNIASVTQEQTTGESTALQKKYPFVLNLNVTISKPKVGIER